MGRPSVDPELMIRMLIVGYSMGISAPAPPLRRGSPQSGLSLVLSARIGRQSPGSLDVLEQQTRALRESDVNRSGFAGGHFV